MSENTVVACLVKEAKNEEYKCINTLCMCMHSRQLSQPAVRLDDMFNSSDYD
jgi:hypothetical protein